MQVQTQVMPPASSPASQGQVDWIKRLRGHKVLAEHQRLGLETDLQQGMCHAKAALWLRVLLYAPDA